MSNLLACILACISVRDKHDEGIKKMCSTGISFGRSKLLQSCSNFTLKPELKKTVNSLFSRQRCSGGFVYWICSYTEQRFKAIAILFRHLQCRYSKDLLFRKNICYTVLNGVLTGLQRESWSFGKNYPLSVYNSPLCTSQFQNRPSPPPRANPGAFDFFEKFWSNSPLCCQFRRSNAPPVRASKRVKSPTLQAC